MGFYTSDTSLVISLSVAAMCDSNGGSAARGRLYLPCYQLQGSVAAMPENDMDCIGYVDASVRCGVYAFGFHVR